jgi:type IV pilus assembly protein PilV
MLNTRKQSGVVLLEAMVGLLIFAIGIIGLIRLQTEAIAQVSDAKYRASAALLANEVLGQMWGDRGNLPAYAQLSGGGGTCAATGAPSTYAPVTAWLSDVTNTLPGASAAMQTIAVTGPANDIVTVTVCWKAARDTGSHHYTAIAQLE